MRHHRIDAIGIAILAALAVGILSLPAAVRASSTLRLVTTTADSGAGSLRQALLDADASGSPSTIQFNIPEADPGYDADGGWFTIAPATPLPELTAGGTTIDGATQTAFTGDTNPNGPEIFLDGRTQVSDGPDLPGGLWLQSSSNLIEGLTVSGFAGELIVLSGGDGNIVRGDYVGTDPTGTSAIVPPVDARAFEDDGIWVVDVATNTTVGGTTAAARNIISGNEGSGLLVASADAGVTIEGNYIGTTADGGAALGDGGQGIAIGPVGTWANQPPPTGVTIGGTAAGAGNVIAATAVANGGSGAGIGVCGANHVTIQGNLIGTDATGTQAIPNETDGILICNAYGTLIGGPTTGARNVISGNANGAGVNLQDDADDNTVQGNYIGTNAAGTAALGNDRGVSLAVTDSPADNNTILGNTISGNGDHGVFVGSGASGTSIRGNRIGTNAAGTAALGNGFVTDDCCGDGVRITSGAANVTVGGTKTADRNVISGNKSAGVGLAGATGATVRGNYIGTNISGTSAIPNNVGVWFYNGVTESTVRANVISGNHDGVALGGTDADTGNTVISNSIGTTANLAAPLPNTEFGVVIGNQSTQTLVRSNTIAFSGDGGIVAMDGTGNTFSRNRVFSNSSHGGLGIDLAGDGVTPNDSGDVDTGPNNLQNYPVLVSALVKSGQLVVAGSIDTPSPDTVTLEFFANAVPSPGGDPSGHGEGAVYLGAATPTASGTFAATLPSAAAGTLISATATDAAGNTSEFAQNIAVGTAPAKPAVTSFAPTSGPAGATVTISGSGFLGATVVKIGTANAQTYTVDSDGQIVATVGTKALSGKVSVTTASGTGTSSGSFTVIAPPKITSFLPASGHAGTTVTLSGGPFTGTSVVSFDGTAASAFTVVSAAKLTAVVAPGTGTGTIKVTTPAGTATSVKTFTSSQFVLTIDQSGGLDSLDPALAYNVSSWQIEYSTCASLLNYPDAAGAAGTLLQPEVATGMPLVSEDGLTYTFTVGSGFAFPSGEPVTADSFVLAIERALNSAVNSPAASFVSDIAGATDYGNGSADSISGIFVDGATLQITLTAQAPDFLARLAMPFFCAVPDATPMSPSSDPVPSAGPYYVSSATGNEVVLVRNPNYSGSRPANPDEIDYFQNVGDATALAQTISGQSDYAPQLSDAGYKSVASKYKSRFVVNPTGGFRYEALNTSRPMFSTVAARQAVNLAINRTLLTSFWGPGAGSPTDQYLTPSTTGFKDAKIYPLNGPSAAQLAKANALVNQAGIRGQTAVLFTCQSSICAGQAASLTASLTKIGLKVSVQTFPSIFPVIGQQGAAFDIAGPAGWIPDYSDPAAVLDPLFDGNTIQPTGNTDFSYFDDSTYNSDLEAANLLSGPDRYTTYGNLDIDLATNAAPVAAVGTVNDQAFFSARIGCEIFQPVYRIDLGALCAK